MTMTAYEKLNKVTVFKGFTTAGCTVVEEVKKKIEISKMKKFSRR